MRTRPDRFLPPGLVARIRSAADRAGRSEICGLLYAPCSAVRPEVTGALLLPNRSPVPALHFRMGGRDLELAIGRLRERGLKPVGTVHSHVGADADASWLDRRMMRKIGGLHLIVGDGGSVACYSSGELRSAFAR